jgi:thioredoxin reductase
MNPYSSSDFLDVIIVGAGPTGLSAALLLGRSRKQVLIIDFERETSKI